VDGLLEKRRWILARQEPMSGEALTKD
jgi:hypothetical protein